MKRRTLGTIIAVLGILVTLLFAHEGHQAITTKGVALGPVSGNLFLEPPARRAVGLSTAKVDFGSIEETLDVPGRVVLPPGRHGFASARVAGVVRTIRVKPGDWVNEGEVLAEISSLEVSGLELELEQRRLERGMIEENLKRARALGERIVAGRETMELEAELEDKTNEIRVLERKLQAIGLVAEKSDGGTGNGPALRNIPIVSPLAGAIVDIDVALGATVEPLEHLFEIQALDKVWVEGEVPAVRAADVRAGMTARVAVPALPRRPYAGKVDRVATSVAEKSRTVGVWVELENKDRALKPGLFARITLVIGLSENVTVAPLRTLVEDGAERYALVQEKTDAYVRLDAKARVEEYAPEKREGYVLRNSYVKKNVVVGRSDGAQVEILEGLYPGDVVVAEAGHELSALYVQGTLKLTDEARKNIGLKTEEIDLRRVGEVVRLSASLRLPVGKTAFASSLIEGKVLRVRVAPGDTVKAGDTLAEVHSLELETLQLDYYRSSLRERLLSRQLDLLRGLGEITPRKDLLRVETDHRTQLSAALSLRRRLEVLGLSKEALDSLSRKGESAPWIPVRAPIAGKVAAFDVAVGQVIRPKDHLFEILDSGMLWAEASVFESDFDKVLGGAAPKEGLLRVAGREIKTTLSFTAGGLASEQKVLLAYADIPNPDGALLPGMLGDMVVDVARPGKEVIAAPLRAILSIGGLHYAFVAEGETFRRIPVELGRQDARWVEVRKGLFPGDQVALSGVNALNTAINSLK